MDTVTRSEENQLNSIEELPLARYIKYLEVFVTGLKNQLRTMTEFDSLHKSWQDDYSFMSYILEDEPEFEDNSKIGTSGFFQYTSEATRELITRIETIIQRRKKELQVVTKRSVNKEIENIKYYMKYDAEWEYRNSFYSDDIDDWETPDFLTSKVTDEVFCTLEGYARLSRLPIEAIFKRVYVLGGCKRFNMQEIDLGDEEVNIIPLTEVAKWLVDDNPRVAKLLIGGDGVILPATFVSQIRNQKTLDTKSQDTRSQVKLIPKTRSIPVQSQPISSNKNTEGTIYLIGNRENNTLKIGFSKDSVRTRLAAFQVSCAHRLEILKTKKGTLNDERELLKRFKKFNIRREWFTWDDSIIAAFD